MTHCDTLIADLRLKGYRITPQREMIVQALAHQSSHMTAEDIFAEVRTHTQAVNLATVYRTLDLLCDLGLARPVYQGTGAAHYVLLDGGSHHHLICIQCQRVIEFDHCGASDVAQTLGRQFNFQVQSHLLEVYGLCEACGGMAEK